MTRTKIYSLFLAAFVLVPLAIAAMAATRLLP